MFSHVKYMKGLGNLMAFALVVNDCQQQRYVRAVCCMLLYFYSTGEIFTGFS